MIERRDIIMYSTNWCGYCQRARNLFERKGIAPLEFKIDEDPGARAAMLEKTGGRRTVPQIFIGDHHVGGYDELAALERSGELDKLLGPPRAQHHDRGTIEDLNHG